MKNQKKIDNNQKNGGGVKWYRNQIFSMIKKIDDEKFLNQIRIILKNHIEKRGG